MLYAQFTIISLSLSLSLSLSSLSLSPPLSLSLSLSSSLSLYSLSLSLSRLSLSLYLSIHLSLCSGVHAYIVFINPFLVHIIHQCMITFLACSLMHVQNTKLPLSQLFLYEKLIVFVRIESTKILACLWLDDLSIRHGPV